MSHVHEETMGGGVRPWQLADLPQELLYRVLDWVWPDGISLSALKGSCKQFRGVVAEYCPQLLSLRWKRCHSTDGGKSDPEEGARVDQACTPHRPTRWGWQASVGPVGSVGIQPTGQQGPREVMDEDGDEGRVGTPPVRCADDVRWGMSSAGASAGVSRCAWLQLSATHDMARPSTCATRITLRRSCSPIIFKYMNRISTFGVAKVNFSRSATHK
jgi:hypothetical protein